jgi:hypothetical protein
MEARDGQVAQALPAKSTSGCVLVRATLLASLKEVLSSVVVTIAPLETVALLRMGAPLTPVRPLCGMKKARRRRIELNI